MPLALSIVIAAAKAGCFLLGSLVHEGKEFMKRFGDEHEVTARASCLLIKDQLGLQETPKESLSNALILYGSREVILSSSSRALAILTSDSLATESQFDVLESNLFSVMNCFKVFAAWYRARCIASVKSAIRSVITDINT
eukprot:scaffold2754_cov149-Skeletonema_menzelii.AAC.2